MNVTPFVKANFWRLNERLKNLVPRWIMNHVKVYSIYLLYRIDSLDDAHLAACQNSELPANRLNSRERERLEDGPKSTATRKIPAHAARHEAPS